MNIYTFKYQVSKWWNIFLSMSREYSMHPFDIISARSYKEMRASMPSVNTPIEQRDIRYVSSPEFFTRQWDLHATNINPSMHAPEWTPLWIGPTKQDRDAVYKHACYYANGLFFHCKSGRVVKFNHSYIRYRILSKEEKAMLMYRL